MSIDISPLARAIQRLDEGMVRYLTDTTDIQIRDGLIQRFEFTYELSHKMLKRYLVFASPTPDEFDGVDFSYLIRSANQQGILLGDWLQWKQYRNMRSKTSHTYDEDIALLVVGSIPAFQQEAHYLHNKIQARLNQCNSPPLI